MSHVTDIILIQDGYSPDWEQTRLALINKHLMETQEKGRLISINEAQEPRYNEEGRRLHWYDGGGKRFQCQIAMSAFGHMDIGAFLKFLREEMPWNSTHGGSVQVLIKDEHDTQFKLHNIWDSETGTVQFDH